MKGRSMLWKGGGGNVVYYLTGKLDRGGGEQIRHPNEVNIEGVYR
jgi:hypothetical protein